MAFAPGDDVHVTSFGKGVVRDVRNGGRYLVEVKGRLLVAAESQLTPVESRRRPPIVSAPSTDLPTRAHALASIDLHGMTVDDAVSAVDAFVDQGILAGLAELRIVHGKGRGRLRSAVHARLRVLGVVRSFRVDPANPGVTIVTL